MHCCRLIASCNNFPFRSIDYIGINYEWIMNDSGESKESSESSRRIYNSHRGPRGSINAQNSTISNHHKNNIIT